MPRKLFRKGHKPANTGKGRGYAFLRDNMNYVGDDCLIWPMKGCDGKHYPLFGHLGKMYLAHRFMCQLAHGDPPTPKHQAAHSCGRGLLGCVNPRHLSWKTNGENQLDRTIMGLRTKPDNPGGQHGKLTEDQIERIRQVRGKMLVKDIAKELGCCTGTINYWHRVFDGGVGKNAATFPNGRQTYAAS